MEPEFHEYKGSSVVIIMIYWEINGKYEIASIFYHFYMLLIFSHRRASMKGISTYYKTRPLPSLSVCNLLLRYSRGLILGAELKSIV